MTPTGFERALKKKNYNCNRTHRKKRQSKKLSQNHLNRADKLTDYVPVSIDQFQKIKIQSIHTPTTLVGMQIDYKVRKQTQRHRAIESRQTDGRIHIIPHINLIT